MFLCAQLDTNGVCRTVARLAGPVDAEHVVPLEDTTDVLGMKYAGGKFYGLAAAILAPSAPVGQNVVIDIRWLDLAGAVVDDPEPVTATCNGTVIPVTMVGGQGSVEFQADSPGVYTITVIAASGVAASAEVTVA